MVDAAVAVSFALGVVEPDASGVGGYGEMLVNLSGMPKPTLLEFMARVPEEASLSNASLLENGRYPSDGPVLAMVPGGGGDVPGMATVRFEEAPWADLLRTGDPCGARRLRGERWAGDHAADGQGTVPQVRVEQGALLPQRVPLKAGDTLKNPDLAWTLEQIAKNGHDGFYKGEVARRLVNDPARQGQRHPVDRSRALLRR
ncbi:MAG: gamma-glutamyltransferase [Gemmatimonadaceae bacterium]